MSILNIGLSSLLSNQYNISVTSNNIANAGIDGYTRQRLNTSSANSILYGGSYFGQGVLVNGVERIGSDYLEVSLRNTRASQQYYGKLYDLGLEVDTMLSDQDTGLDKTMQSFFTAMGDLANNPTSEATRSVVLDAMSELGGKFENMAYVLELASDTVNKDMVAYTEQLNTLATDLVKLNKAAASALATTGQVSSSIADARNKLLSDMSDIVDLNVTDDGNGMVSVYIADGLALVSNNSVKPLEARSNGFGDGEYELYMRGMNVTNRLNGGELGGVVEYRADVLNLAQNSLGQLSLGFTQLLNAQHKLGYTPDGVAGGDLFANFETIALPHEDNVGSGILDVYFDTSGSLDDQKSLLKEITPRSYEIVFNGTGYDVSDANSGELLLSNAPASFSLEGLEFDMAGAPIAGDVFRVSPMKDAISNYEVLITDTQSIANASDPDGSISDNRNSLALLELQNANVMNGGIDSLQAGYSTLVATVGSKVASAESNSATYEVLYTQALQNRESESGVNTEEEAAKLIELQQRYSASAKIIAAAQQIFDDLINSIGL